MTLGEAKNLLNVGADPNQRVDTQIVVSLSELWVGLGLG